ncbi:MAG: AAA family ATPase [Motilibacteraceae bacterium]
MTSGDGQQQSGAREQWDEGEFARAFRRFLEWVHQNQADDSTAELASLISEHLGPDDVERSVVTAELPPFEHVNLQVALNAWMIEPGRTVQVHGISVPAHHGGWGLQQLLAQHALPPLRLSSPPLVDLPSGPGQTIACYQLALLLVEDGRGRSALLVRAGDPRRGEPTLALEVAGLQTEQAQQLLAELARLRHELNVYRGHVLDVVPGMGGISLEFAELPETGREDVVLPEDVLARIERHALQVAAHRDALLAAGQHLRRGLLLFGPPGTGKTHTTRYLVRRLAGSTVLLLRGHALAAVGEAARVARDLQPSVVVLEDVDLVARERTLGPGGVLFDLLDAMDGASPDADLLFLLTTNRADLLEPALASRPGRVDLAVEIGLPDEEARRRLLELYTRHLTVQADEAQLADVVARSEGVTASFVKELVRRAVVDAVTAGESGQVLSGQRLAGALDELLGSAHDVTRALHGMRGDDAHAAAGDGPVPGQEPGWFAYSSRGRLH